MLKRIFLLCMFCITIFYAANGYAQITRIEVLVPADNVALADLAGGIQHALQQTQFALPVTIRIADGSTGNDTQNTLVVAVGDALLQQTNLYKTNYPAIIAFYVSSSNYLLQPHNDDKVTALYRDQPLSRQLQLAKLLLPNLRRVGIIHGHRNLAPSVTQLERSSKLQIQAIDIEDKPDWPKYLSQLMMDNDVLLGVDDPVIYNGETIRSILLTTYRRGKFLIGPGRAFVNAGSLASCYTAPDQYLKQLVDMVGHLLRAQKLPSPQYPRAFRAAINPQVAASLGLATQDENTLTARLLNEVGQGPSGECGDGC
jgi:putative tryptophan/tyrosine transport system substrate-binding protein